MTIEVRVPQLPESVADATLVSWHKKAGDTVARDENLVDLETDKVVLEVPAPAAGVLKEIKLADGTVVTSGQVLALIEEGATAGAAATAPPPAKPAPVAAPAAAAAQPPRRRHRRSRRWRSRHGQPRRRCRRSCRHERLDGPRRGRRSQVEPRRQARDRGKSDRSEDVDRLRPRRTRLEVRHRQLSSEQGCARGLGAANGSGRQSARACGTGRPERARRACGTARADDASARTHRRTHGAGAGDASAADLLQRGGFARRQRTARPLQGAFREAAWREARLHVVLRQSLRRSAEKISVGERLGRWQRYRVSRVFRHRHRGVDRSRPDRARIARYRPD